MAKGVKGFYNTNRNYDFFVADEGDGVYNVFSYDDFDEDGYAFEESGVEGYHISDYDIVFESDDFEEACNWIDVHYQQGGNGR